MSHQLLQINMNYNVAPDELKDIFAHAADAIASFPGLVWKIWIVNDDKREAGGIYWFESQQALFAYLDSPIVANLKSHPAFSQISVKSFDTVDDLNVITHSPI